MARIIGEWEGAPVWRCAGNGVPREMGSVRRLLDQDRGLSSLPGAACSWRFLPLPIAIAATAAMRCISAAPKAPASCGPPRTVLPRGAPCVIVAIQRDDQILLAQHTCCHRGFEAYPHGAGRFRRSGRNAGARRWRAK